MISMQRTTTFLIRLAPTEKTALSAAAAAADLPLSVWIRQTLLGAIEGAKERELGATPVAEADATIRVPVSTAELEVMKTLAHAAGIPVGRWARATLRKESPRSSKPSLESQELVDQLRRIGTNLNQLTRLANGGQLGAADSRRLLEVLDAVAESVGQVETRLVIEGRR